MFLDGSLGSRTAWMLEPYEGTRDRGMPITSRGRGARARCALAADAGIACHGARHRRCGGAARARPDDARSPGSRIPHRIEHFQCVHPADLDRAAGAGIVRLDAAGASAHRHSAGGAPLGRARPRGLRVPSRCAARGTALVFGSDVPVASHRSARGALRGARAPGRRRAPAGGWRPEEKLGFEDAVRAYTVGAAHAARTGSARRAGSRPGCDADLVAWAFDPAVERGDGDAVPRGPGVLTVVGGEVVMQR